MKNELKCSHCKKTKNKTEFSKSKSSHRGYDYRCKECNRNRAKTYHKDNKENILIKWKAKRDKESSEDKKIKAIKNTEWYWSDVKRNLYNRAKERARKRNIDFDLTIDDIVIPEKCPLLEVPFIKGFRSNKWYTYSIDRIDNSKGYTKDNVQVITYLANTMKSKASKEELLTFARNIIELLSK